MSVLTVSDDSAGVVTMACELATKILWWTAVKQVTIAAVLFGQKLIYVIELMMRFIFIVYF